MDEALALSLSIIKKEFNLVEENNSTPNFIVQLTATINEMIKNDFPRLVNILYRLDVSEEKLKTELQDNPSREAGALIADLIIERQLQKVEARKHSRTDEDIPDNEKW